MVVEMNGELVIVLRSLEVKPAFPTNGAVVTFQIHSLKPGGRDDPPPTPTEDTVVATIPVRVTPPDELANRINLCVTEAKSELVGQLEAAVAKLRHGTAGTAQSN